MKTINVPSVAGERCNIDLEFDNENFKLLSCPVTVKCTTPSFTGKLRCRIETDYIKEFTEDLSKVEKVRNGQCQLGYQLESAFSLEIHSIDSLGHFVCNLTIQDARGSAGVTTIDCLNISYEIESSTLIKLVDFFERLFL